MTSVGYATLNIVPSARGFASALGGEINTPLKQAGDKAGDSSSQGFLSKFKGGLGKAIGAVAGSAAVTATVGFMKGCVSSAGDLEQSMGAIDSVFKGSAGQMHAWAKTAATDVGLTKNEYNELGTLIGSQLKNAGTSMEELGPKTNDLIGLGADLSSMFGGTTKEAVEAISSALKGERDPIEKYGVSLKQAQIEAKAMEMGLMEAGGEMSKEAETAATLALIMDQTKDAHGNFAREGETLAHKQQVLAANWENLKTTIGEKFLPLVTPVVGWIGDVVAGFTSLISGEGSGAPGWFGTVVEAVRPLGEAFMGMIQSMQPFFDWLGQVVPPILQGFKTIWDGVWNGIKTVFSGVFEFMQGVFQVFAGIFQGDWSLVWEGVKNIFSGIWNALGGILEAALGIIKGAVEVACNVIKAIWEGAWNWIKHIFGMVWEGIKAVCGPALDWIKGVIDGACNWVKGVWEGAWNGIKSFFSGVWDGIKAIASGAWDFIKAVFQAGINFVKAIWDAFWTGLKVIVDLAWQGIKFLVQGAIDFIKSVINGWVIIITGIWETCWNGIKNFIGPIWESIKTAVSDGVNGAVEFIRGLPQKAMDALGNVGNKLFESGKSLIQGFIDGIKSMADGIGDQVSGVLDKIREFFPFSPAKRGPFSGLGYTTYSGQALARDFAAGIAGQTMGVESAATSLMGAASSALSTASSTGGGIAAALGAGASGAGDWAAMGVTVGEGMAMLTTTIGDGMTAISEDWALQWQNVAAVLGIDWSQMQVTTMNAMNMMTVFLNTTMTQLNEFLTATLNAINVHWQNTWNAMLAHVQALWPVLQEFVNVQFVQMQTTITTFMQQIQLFWNTTWTAMQNHTQVTMTNIAANIASAMSNILYNISNHMSTIQGVWTVGWNAVRNVVADAWNQATNACRTGMNNVITVIRELPGNIRGAIGDVGSTLKASGESLMNGFIEGIRAAGKRVGAAIETGLEGGKDYLPNSPAKKGPFSGKGWTLYSGQAVMRDFAKGITQRGAAAADAAADVVAATQAAFAAEAPQIAAPKVQGGGIAGALTGNTSGQQPLVGNLTLQSSGNVRDDLNETMFQLRRISRGGAHA